MQKCRKQEDFLCLSLVLNGGFKDVNLGLQESAGKLPVVKVVIGGKDLFHTY